MPWTAAHQSSLSFTISWNLLKIMSIESVMSFNYLIFCHPLVSHLQSFLVFSSVSAFGIRRPKYSSFSFSTPVLPINMKGWFPWKFSGWDSMFPQQGAHIQSLVRELRSHRLHSMVKYLKWITNKDLLYSKRNSAQYYAATWIGVEFGEEWIYVHTWVSSFAITNTA